MGPYVQQKVAEGYGGYAGWEDREAEADFNAGHGEGKRTGGRSSGPSTPQSATAADFAKLEEQAFEMLKPYYLKIAQESRGDFNRAISILDEDYSRGVRIAREDTTKEIGRTNEDLGSTLERLGISFKSEDESKIDELNRRGMAVTEAGPGQPLNVLKEGRGSVEIDRLRSDQALRKEAVDRAAKRNISDLTTNLGRYTSPEATGKTPAQLSSMDRSQLGTAELGLVRGTEQATRGQQQTEQGLFEQRRAEAQRIAGLFADTQDRKISTDFAKRYTDNALTDFREGRA